MKQTAVLVALLGLGCLGPRVDVKVSPDTDFAGFGTYAHKAPHDASQHDSNLRALVGESVKAEIDRGLGEKGYRAAAAEEADLWVVFRVHGVSRARLTNTGDPDANYNVMENRLEETVVIEVLDARDGRRLWEGQSTREKVWEGAAGKGPDLGDAAVKLAKAILGRFPPE